MDYTCIILKKGSMFLIKKTKQNKKTIHVILAAFPISALAIYSSISNLHEEDFFFFLLACRRHLVCLCIAVGFAAYGMTEN